MPPKKTRKRQARLTFEPLTATSPHAAALSEGVQDRAAAVRYSTGSVVTRRATRSAALSNQSNFELPAIASSSHTPLRGEHEGILDHDGKHFHGCLKYEPYKTYVS